MHRNARYEDLTNLVPVVVTAATKTVGVHETLIHVDTTSNAVALTMPNAGAADGKTFYIDFITDGGNDLTVATPEPTPAVSLTFADAKDRLVLKAMGGRWFIVENNGGS